jgi:S1-C subfamily serine protease
MSQADGAPRPEVVRVVVEEHGSGTKKTFSMGSGVLLDDGLILTAWHVVREAPDRTRVQFPGGPETPVEFIAGDAGWDVALFRLDDPGGKTPARLAETNPRPRDRLIIAGYGPPPYIYRESPGALSGYVSPDDLGIDEFLESYAHARDGDSGGPFFNDRGEVAGIVCGYADGRSCGCSAVRLREFLSRDAVRLKGKR